MRLELIMSLRKVREVKYYLTKRFGAKEGATLKALVEYLIAEAVADEAMKELREKELAKHQQRGRE